MLAFFTKTAPEVPKQAISFQFYQPVIKTDQLVPGIDNLRFDVSLSSKFMQSCRTLIFQLIVKHSEVAPLLAGSSGPPKPSDRKEFKQRVQDLLLNVLNHAKNRKEPQLELLAQAAILKFLAGEMQAQYALVIVQAREKLKLFESPTHTHAARGYQLQEIFGNFQKNKKNIIRLVGQELLEIMEEVRGNIIAKTRESYFGMDASAPLAIFSNPLVFTDDGKDDALYLQHYVMLGNFHRDPDRYELVEQEVRSFLELADSSSEAYQHYRAHFPDQAPEASLQDSQKQNGSSARRFFSRGRNELSIDPAPEPPPEKLTEAQRLMRNGYAARLNKILCCPENALLLVDVARTERWIAEAEKAGAEPDDLDALRKQAEAQRARLEQLYERVSRAGLAPYLVASYVTAKMIPHFGQSINPQQLKGALVDPLERKKLTHLIQEYRLPSGALETLEDAARRVRDAGPREVRQVLVRFLHDFFRCRYDLRNFQLVRDLMEKVHLPTDPKQVELSEINHTLYKFLLPEEEAPTEEKVASHVIMKADIRDSTTITAQLLAQGLNPASYFSLNFFDPIRKLMPRYGAANVFLEGDAMILSIMEKEGEIAEANSVARACCLARDMMEGVRAVNDRAAQSQLPLLDLGIGICYQPSAPMYLMDGERPIMISKALNESDRLSSCGKLAKQLLSQKSRFFNVFVMQLLPDVESRGSADEFLLHYNVQGIELNEVAFEKLGQELSMVRIELKLPLFGEQETVEFFCGSLARAGGTNRLVVRRGRIPHINPKDLHVEGYTDRHYYEVCTAKPIYEYVGKQQGW